MKLNNDTYKSIASHSLVVAIFVNPYFLLTLTDLYRILFNDQSTIVNNYSLFIVMNVLSTAAFTLSAVAFYFTSNRYEWITTVLAGLLILLSWQLSIVYIPLGFVSLLSGLALVVFRVTKHQKHAKKAK